MLEVLTDQTDGQEARMQNSTMMHSSYQYIRYEPP